LSDIGGEVRLGSMLFTLVEPHRGHEMAYNRWYERDHFYAGCMVGPWLFAGRRFVATRALKDLRFGTEVDIFGGADLGSYVAIYWVLDGKHDEHFGWGLRQVHWLHENDRMFAERDHTHTLLYRYEGMARANPDGVPAELALDHPYGGVTATLIRRAAGVDVAALRKHVIDTTSPELDLAFSPIPLPPNAPVTQQGQDRLADCVLTLSFSSENPADRWDDHRAVATRLQDDGIGEVLWSAPFIPTIPGTDTYTDQLW